MALIAPACFHFLFYVRPLSLPPPTPTQSFFNGRNTRTPFINAHYDLSSGAIASKFLSDRSGGGGSVAAATARGGGDVALLQLQLLFITNHRESSTKEPPPLPPPSPTHSI